MNSDAGYGGGGSEVNFKVLECVGPVFVTEAVDVTTSVLGGEGNTVILTLSPVGCCLAFLRRTQRNFTTRINTMMRTVMPTTTPATAMPIAG